MLGIAARDGSQDGLAGFIRQPRQRTAKASLGPPSAMPRVNPAGTLTRSKIAAAVAIAPATGCPSKGQSGEKVGTRTTEARSASSCATWSRRGGGST
jgi:hypothetical protein